MFILVIVKVQGKVLSVCLFLSVFYFSGEIPNSDQRRLLGYTGPVFTGLRAREGWWRVRGIRCGARLGGTDSLKM